MMNIFSPPKTVRVKRGYVRNQHLFAHTITADPQQAHTTVATFETPDRLERREYAWRSASLESEFAVPLCAAVGCGVCTALLAGSVAYLGARPYTVTAVVLTFSSVSTVALWRFISRQLDSLWTIEEYTTETAAPPRKQRHYTPPKEVQIEVAEMQHGRLAHMKFLDLPISDHQLQQLAIHVVANEKAFSRRSLCPQILSRGEYETVRAKLHHAGFLRQIDNKGTVELTTAGRKMLSKLY